MTRLCPFCRTRTMSMAYDDDNKRAYECAHCLAVEKITKGKTSWWYHGAQALDNGNEPGCRIDGDGVRSKAPIPFAKWLESAGPSDAFSY